jgi:mannose-6-phosphate isomerase
MFVGLSNIPRDYAWGSKTAIAALLGRAPSGASEAEYWLGTHPGSPAVLVEARGGAKTLDQIANLPFIMKVLAAESSLSLQAHPSPEQAAEGFARENALGIPIDAPNRNYKDSLHKPELIYALSDGFEALCGFRPVAATRQLLATLGPDPLIADFIARLVDDASLPAVFEWLISNGDGVAQLRARVLELAPGARGDEFVTVLKLAAWFPDDVGILISLLLNLVTMRVGEAIYLPSGNIHAYQHGLGIEVLAASDNVLRGGLTPKHVDVPELLHVLDFRPAAVPFMTPEHPEAGVSVFRPDSPDFELVVLRPDDAVLHFALSNEAIMLCTDGEVDVRGVVSRTTLRRGEAAYVTADEGTLEFAGSGRVFLATTNTAAS